MGKYIIEGGNRLNGEVLIGGAKNSVLPIIAATILNGGMTILKNVPLLSDTFVAIDILRALGCSVDIGENTIVINTKDMYKTEIREDLVKKMRSSIIFLGSTLARFKKGSICYPGGCNLGKRPIDFHLSAFQKMGIKIEDEEVIKADATNIKEAVINLPLASVGATQNIMLASIFTNGETVIKNSAREPEIIDLAEFLREMGADISGDGTDTITIKGVKRLKEIVEYEVMPDRIEAGTFLCMGALTGGRVRVSNIYSEHLKSLTEILKSTGCELEIKGSSITTSSPSIIKPIAFLETNPYPYFPTDLQPQLTSFLALANGTSKIKENLFEARNKHIPELNKMGADILEENNVFIVRGVKSLAGAEVYAKDLRGGASLITAGLVARGKTIVNGCEYIQRGYEKIENKLQLLGANIKYIED